jgi:hypothetical protein
MAVTTIAFITSAAPGMPMRSRAAMNGGPYAPA